MTRVMLVDDDLELVELLAHQLKRAGYQVRFADSCASAVEIARAEPRFDLLITDLHLPDADGAEVAAQLKAHVSLALTGSSAPSDVARLRAAGFAEVLVKPLTGRQMLEAVTRCVGVPR